MIQPAILWALAANTVRESVRQKFFTVVVFLSVCLMGSSQIFGAFDFERAELRFIADFGSGAIGIFGALLAIVLTCQVFFNDIDNRTVQMVLAKPVSRAEFLLGKLLGLSGLLLIFVSLLLLVQAGLLYWRESLLLARFTGDIEADRIVHYAGFVGLGLAQWIRLTLLAAMTLWGCTLVRTWLLAMFVGVVAWMAAQFQHIAFGFWQRLAESGDGAFLLGVVVRAVPNFQLFDVSTPFLFPTGPVVFGDSIWQLVVYGGGYIAAFCLLAILTFQRREL